MAALVIAIRPPRPDGAGPHPAFRLSVARGIGFLVLYLLLPEVLATVASLLALPGSDLQVAFGYSALLLGYVVVTGILLARYRGPRSASFREAVGLRRATAEQVAFGFFCGAALGVVCLAVASAAGVAPGVAAALLEPLTESSSLEHKLQACFFLFASPFFEEFVFRGVLLASLAKSWGFVLAVTTTTVLFVGIHPAAFLAPIGAIPFLAILSLTCCYLRARSASLVPAICAHFAYNAAIIVGVHAALAYLSES